MTEQRLIDAEHFLKRVLPLCIIPNELKKNVDDEPAVDAVPVDRLKDLCERWTSVCAICIYEECDKCVLKVCIDELKEIIDSSEREDSEKNV